MQYRLATTVNPRKFLSDSSVLESWSNYSCVSQVILIQPEEDLTLLADSISNLPASLSKKLCIKSFKLIFPSHRILPPVPDLFSLVSTLQLLNPDTNAPILFLNSDLIITSEVFFRALSDKTKLADISYLFRYDKTASGLSLGFYNHGVDAFLLRSPSVFLNPKLSLKHYFIGLPCWDHFLPIYTSFIASQVFLRIPSLTHLVHSTSNPGHYSVQVPHLLSDILSTAPYCAPFRPILLIIFKLLCSNSILLSILHKSIVYPRLHAIGWPIARSRY